MQFPQMSPPWYPHSRLSCDLLVSSGSESRILFPASGSPNRCLKRSYFPSYASPVPHRSLSLAHTFHPPTLVIPLESLSSYHWARTLPQTTTLPSSVKLLKITSSKKPIWTDCKGPSALPDMSLSNLFPQQQLLHNNLFTGWALSPESKMCKMNMDGIFKGSRQNSQNRFIKK